MSRTVCRCRARVGPSFFSTWPGHWPTSISPRSLSFSLSLLPPPLPSPRWRPMLAAASSSYAFERTTPLPAPTSSIVAIGRSSRPPRCLHHNRPPPLLLLFFSSTTTTIPVPRRRLWLSHAIPAHAVARGTTSRQPPSTWLTGWANGARKRSALEIAWKVQSNRFAGCSLRVSLTITVHYCPPRFRHACISTDFHRSDANRQTFPI